MKEYETIGKLENGKTVLQLFYGRDKNLNKFIMLEYHTNEPIKKLIIATNNDSIKDKKEAVTFWDNIQKKYGADISSIEEPLFHIPKMYQFYDDTMFYTIETSIAELNSIF